MKTIFTLAMIVLINSIGYSQCPPSISYAGMTYRTVVIGKQCWLKENLNVGKMIKFGDEPTTNETLEKYCQDNDSSNCNKYGGLYQWEQAMQYSTAEKAKGICPTGWHLPAKSEMEALEAAVDKNAYALESKGKMFWGEGTNTSGFSALPGGFRSHLNSIDEGFSNLGSAAYLWTSTATDGKGAWGIYIDGRDVKYTVSEKDRGFSIRCVKD